MILCTLILACSTSSASAEYDQQMEAWNHYMRRQDKVNHLTYHRDSHVNDICYSVFAYYRQAIMATVPCEKVKHLIKKKPDDFLRWNDCTNISSPASTG